MMGDVNLIPAARLARMRLRKRLRLWATIGGTYTLLLVTGSLAARVLYPAENHSLAAQLAEAAQQIEQAEGRMLELNQELADATGAWETTRALEELPDWSRLLVGLSHEMGEEVVLNRFELVALGGNEPILTKKWKESLASRPLDVLLAERRHKLVLRGFGRTQESVSQFVLRLEALGAFELVRLANSCRQAFLDGRALAFTVECHF
jgi:hypothetical protein